MIDRVLTVFTVTILSVVILSYSSSVSARDITVIGEARMIGQCFVKSAAGRWLPAPTSYPVAQDTTIRTGDGSAAIYFKDGSMAFFCPGSEAAISGSFDNYVINLLKGRVAFNVMPAASLSVGAGPASALVNGKENSARHRPSHIRGTVTLRSSSTRILSIDGMMTASINSYRITDMNAGDVVLIGPDDTPRVFPAGAVKDTEMERRRRAAALFDCSDGAVAVPAGLGIAQAGILVGFSGGAAFAVKEGFSGPSDIASCYCPGARKIR